MPDNSADASRISLPQLSGPQQRAGLLGLRRRFDQAVLRVCARLIAPTATGRLSLTLPSGANTVIDGAKPGTDAHLVLHNYGVFWRSIRRGSIGFAESMIEGETDSTNLVALFGYFIENKETLRQAGRGKFRVRREDRVYHRSRSNTRDGSRANIAAHYDLGNAFYRLWLDASMTYSSALYPQPTLSLELAQQAKCDRILDALELTPGQRLLEIGCGWGHFAMSAARRGVQVTGLTLSREQLAEAEALSARSGLAAATGFRLEDYRDTTGSYDRIASIEMIEAVGEENWPQYFATLHDRLTPGGVAVLQAITIDDAIYDTYRAKADFIQRYIFPGGALPTHALIEQHAHAAGLTFETVQLFGQSYALTLAEWRRSFHTAWPEIARLGFDERFRRMWDYYLAYCQAGFERGTCDVGIYRFRKPINASATAEHPLNAPSKASGL
jgi:cyclopropane-fatty-acyl-phospholipid synthase